MPQQRLVHFNTARVAEHNFRGNKITTSWCARHRPCALAAPAPRTLVAWLSCWRIPSNLSSRLVHGAQVFMVEFLAEAALRRVQQGCQLLLLGAPHMPTLPNPPVTASATRAGGGIAVCVTLVWIGAVCKWARVQAWEPQGWKKRASAESLVRWPPHPNTSASR